MKIRRIFQSLFFFACFLWLFFPVLAYGQVTVAPFENARVTFLDANGKPVAAGCLSTFAAGTTSVQATYSDLGVTLNANPIILDSTGSAVIYLQMLSYKFQLKSTGGTNCSTGSTLWTQDNVNPSTPLSTFASLISTGALTMQQPTAATSGANQSSFNFCEQGSYWTGSAAATDQWCWIDTLGAGANPTSTYTLTHSGSSGGATISLANSVNMGSNSLTAGTATITGALTAGSVTSTGASNFGGPEPWTDVTNIPAAAGCTNLVADGVTDNTARFNCLLTFAATLANKVHVIYFPAALQGYRFASKPNAIAMELIIKCGSAPTNWNPVGQALTQLLVDYTEATATNAFLDFTGQTSPGNSGVVGCEIWKNTGQTGGTAIKYEGTSTTQRAGEGPIEDNRISGAGTWNWGLRVDCTNITTVGSPGCRDISVRNLSIFQTTTGCMSLNNAIHFKWQDGGCFGTGASPNAHVDVTGTSSANAQSINVEFSNVEILDTLALDWVGGTSNPGFSCAACTVNNLTATVNTATSFFNGISINAPVVTGVGQLAYTVNDPVNAASQSTFVGALRSATWVATGTAPASIASGDIAASSGTTAGSIRVGSDGLFTLRRNNGSGPGTNLAITFDGFSTTPYQFDTTNGFTTTRPLLFTGASSITKYNNVATAGQGVPPIYGATSQKAETQAADANVLTVTPPATIGTYRVSVAISVTSATTGVISYTVSWTDSSGNAQTNVAGPLFQFGTAAPATTFTTSAAGNYSGDMLIDTNNAAANIVVKWVGGGTTVAKMSATIERLN